MKPWHPGSDFWLPCQLCKTSGSWGSGLVSVAHLHQLHTATTFPVQSDVTQACGHSVRLKFMLQTASSAGSVTPDHTRPHLSWLLLVQDVQHTAVPFLSWVNITHSWFSFIYTVLSNLITPNKKFLQDLSLMNHRIQYNEWKILVRINSICKNTQYNNQEQNFGLLNKFSPIFSITHAPALLLLISASVVY